MAAAARLLLKTTPREALVSGLNQLLHPLRWLRLEPQRFCLRLVLTLEYALVPLRGFDTVEEQGKHKGLIRRATGLVQTQFLATRQRADQAPLGVVSLPALRAPVWYQWLYPVMIVLGLFALSVNLA